MTTFKGEAGEGSDRGPGEAGRVQIRGGAEVAGSQLSVIL